MEIRHCRYFLAVVAAGNFTEAAARQNVSQPTLSQQIKQLEEQLGAQLFVRGGRMIQLTEAGETLLPHARLLLQTVEAAELEVAGTRTLGGGHLRVAYVPSQEQMVAQAIAQFIELHPKVRLNMRLEVSSVIEDLVLTLEADLGISAGRQPPPELHAVHLARDQFVLAFRRDHPLEQQGFDHLSEIGDVPFAIYSPANISRAYSDAYLREIGFRPNVMMEASSLVTLLSIVSTTNACALLPRRAVIHHSGIRYCVLKNPPLPHLVSILSRKRQSLSPPARVFTKLLQDAVRNDTTDPSE